MASGVIRKFRGVKQTNDTTIIENGTLGGIITGVALEDIDSTSATNFAGKRTCTVQVEGIARGIASAAIVVGAKVACAADGRFLTAVSTNHVIGVCTVAAGAAGDQFEFEILRGSVLA
jgi:hypothetical protein